jgi:hypothetical protein
MKQQTKNIILKIASRIFLLLAMGSLFAVAPCEQPEAKYGVPTFIGK